MTFNTGDWCIYDLEIVQIMATEPYVEYSTGFIRGGNATRGNLRPLTLQNKVIIESMDSYYERLRDMDGSVGFNSPDISRYFADLSRTAIDGDKKQSEAAFEKAQAFVRAARDYQKIIDGIALFRPR